MDICLNEWGCPTKCELQLLWLEKWWPSKKRRWYIIVCMYNHYYYFRACPCARINFLPRAPLRKIAIFFLFFFSNRTNNRFQKAERLKSMDKNTLLAFLNRKGYKNKHGPDVSTYIHTYTCVYRTSTYVRAYQNHNVCTYIHNTYHVFPWKVLPGKRLQSHIIKPQVIDLQGRSGLKKKKKKPRAGLSRLPRLKRLKGYLHITNGGSTQGVGINNYEVTNWAVAWPFFAL